jgi:hypothetical protein
MEGAGVESIQYNTIHRTDGFLRCDPISPRQATDRDDDNFTFASIHDFARWELWIFSTARALTAGLKLLSPKPVRRTEFEIR